MGYAKALEVAGAEILEFEQFGSYQGQWWAKVVYNGQTCWVSGSYGSCSGCDAFQSEFDSYNTRHSHEDNDWFEPVYDGFVDGCEKCDATKARLIAFGQNYLDDWMTQEQAEASAKRDLDWDHDAQEMLDFIVNNA